MSDHRPRESRKGETDSEHSGKESTRPARGAAPGSVSTFSYEAGFLSSVKLSSVSFH